MIEILNKKDCCGCSACVQICPVKCIHLQEDEEGFLYPVVDTEKCIACGQCEKVCPFINIEDERKPIKVFAAQSKDDRLRLNSSSGGIFSLLAERVLAEGGVVFGVRFDDNWQPVFDCAENITELDAFRGSKYVQAIVGNAYIDAKAFLKQGRKVMFSGTACQIAGLKKFLKTEYENLLTVDVVCHGVPSPLVWRQYLQEIKMSERREDRGKNTVLSSPKDIPVITDISFRDKKLGWKKYSFVVRGKSAEGGQNSVLLSDIHYNNKFMQAFLKNLILRPSCYNCKVKSGRSESDITIADYWGVNKFHPEMDDDMGTSLVLTYSPKGLSVLSAVVSSMNFVVSDLKKGLLSNPCIKNSVSIPKYRFDFWKMFSSSGFLSAESVIKKMQPSLLKKSYLKIRFLIKRVLLVLKILK